MDELEDDVIRPWRIFLGGQVTYTHLEFSCITRLELRGVERN